MKRYLVEVIVEKVEGRCALGYKPGDKFVVKEYYIEPGETRICIHALSSMLTLLSPFLKGIPATKLGIGKEDNIGYIACPDPGQPYTCGGRVVFKLVRNSIVGEERR